jgi:urease accessory protein
MSEAGLLALTQWLSPAFPLGSFAYSHGLEAAVAAGEVTDAAGVERWIGDVLAHGAGWNDAVLLALALADGTDHVALAGVARALAASRERLEETEAQGTALAATVSALSGRSLAPMPFPVALGAAAAPLGLPAERVVALYLQAFAGTLALAAVRFVPLGQTEGQRVLAALHPAILTLAEGAVRAAGSDGLEALGGAALGADLAAMRHETLEVRIFRT